MRRSLSFALIMAGLIIALLTGMAGAQQLPPQQPRASVSGAASGTVDVERIVRAFTAKETAFRQALTEYSFKRDATIQTIALGGQISGEYRRVSRFVLDDQSRLTEKILFFPMPTISEIQITPEDLQDLGGVQPFALESSKINLYNFNYVGKERIDELEVYIFDVTPKANLQDPKVVKQLVKNKARFFQGRVWVDAEDLQIVKTRGKGVPEDKNNKYPTFETYREQIDGRYWFPTYTYADDEIVFDNGQVTRLRMRVKYTDFEKLRGKVRVIGEGEPGVESEPAPTPAPAKKP